MKTYLAILCCALPLLSAQKPTFTKDVAPILQKRCQECHRPGEIGPFSLLTYKDARPWAAAIKNAVVRKTMPPWHADRHIGKFSNDRSLSQGEIDIIAAWVAAGAPEGDAKDMPAPVTFTDGWGIPKPDVIFQLPEPYQIPASGTIEYLHWLVPTNFKTDKWVQFAEARPGDRAHVHHIIAYVREPGSAWMKDIKPGIPFIPEKPKADEKEDMSALPSDFLVGYAPGQPPEAFEPGVAKLVKAGSDIILQVHYTTDGKASTDLTRVGLVFAKQPPAKRVMTFSATNGKFKIPAGDPNHRVDAEFELGTDVVLHGLHPHMHARGKDFIYHVRFPDGRRETLLSVPHYSFAWQLWYNLEKPLFLPKGTVFECTAHFDNSPNNKFNPDPKKDVTWGDQSWDEMMVGFFNLVFDAGMDEKKVHAPPKEAAKPADGGQ
ncbi:MAG: cytochrome c [Acidobacteriota bacterium]